MADGITEETPEPTGLVADAPEGTETPTEEPQAPTPQEEPEGSKEAPEGAPETYEFKLPEDASVGDGVQEVFKELNLTNEQAQKLVDAHFESEKARIEGAEAELEEMKDSWWSDAQKDPEIGGSSFKENAAIASKGLKQFADDEVLAMMQETGFDRNAAFIRMFHRIGKAISEDKVVVGGANSAPKQSTAERMFPSMTPTK